MAVGYTSPPIAVASFLSLPLWLFLRCAHEKLVQPLPGGRDGPRGNFQVLDIFVGSLRWHEAVLPGGGDAVSHVWVVAKCNSYWGRFLDLHLPPE